mgnify:CR=1 FL=1
MKRTSQCRLGRGNAISILLIVAGFVIICLCRIFFVTEPDSTAKQLELARAENERLAVKCQNLEAQLAETIYLERQVERLADELAKLREAITLEPWPVPLEPELQAHTYRESIRSGIPVEIALAIMEHESGYISDVSDHINCNGTRDRGLMQINEVNWEFLREKYGLDVSDPPDNITVGKIILLESLQDYPMEKGGE